MAIDGSEGHLIHIEGMEDYSVDSDVDLSD